MVDCSQALSDPPEPYLAVRLDGGSNRDWSSAMSHSTHPFHRQSKAVL